MPRSLASVLLALCTVVSAAHGSDWPQFRGPGGQGHAPTGVLPLEWDRETNIDWQVGVPGKGWSSPVIVGGRVYLTTAVADGEDSRDSGAAQSWNPRC